MREEHDRAIAWELPFWAAFLVVMGLTATVGLPWPIGVGALLLIAVATRVTRRYLKARGRT